MYLNTNSQHTHVHTHTQTFDIIVNHLMDENIFFDFF